MEYLTIKTWGYKAQAKECWHFWFAWYPVTIGVYPDGAKKMAWLQKVLRKGEYKALGLMDCAWVYEYKLYLKGNCNEEK